ncbi:DUF6443 domain-containing protein [Chitinophaga agri]|uniref:DUF6443 domain-containing protein n=1 Tax=Chitinophaga agri TaxID=2703787 RepID=A0A6B9ZKE9_9BACT|nr:DUF6443 domain-containing protein [Chitinophaga agri]QHS62868.1 hypothetical protein GWR21_25775 [Chitinophaga agri]
MKSLLYIKKTVGCLVTIIAPLVSVAQTPNIPTGAINSAVPIAPPAAYSNTTINYVRTWIPNLPLKDTAVVAATSRSIREVKQTTQYSDGLGRPIQQVAKGISPNGKDMVEMSLYDQYGRQQYRYLPYAHQAAGDGKFKMDPFNTQNAFYKNGVLNPGAVGESIFYAKVEYEASPLDREIKIYPSGNSWVTRPKEMQYKMNADNDSVRKWTLGSGLPVSTGYYSGGELIKAVTIDEQGNQKIEYKDKDDKVILKKVQVEDAPANGASGWLCTYNIYNDLGDLQYVIPPSAVEAIKSNWTMTNAVDTGLCFRYDYDARQRIIVKRIPGQGRVFMVYDIRDRLVFTQDSVQRAKSPMEWMVMFYDDINRPVMTGIYKSTTTPDVLQSSLNAASGSLTISYVSPPQEDLAVYEHDGRASYTATNSVLILDGFDSGTNPEFVVEINSTTTGDTTKSVVSNPLPGLQTSALTPLTYTFYDNYNYSGRLSFVGSDTLKLSGADTLFPERRPVSYNAEGLITGVRSRILGTDKWLTTTNYYNDKARLVQIVSENHMGGKDVTSMLYNFKGLPLAVYLRHQNPKSVTPQMTMLTRKTYDHADRLLTITKRLNDDASLERIITSDSYDELGRLGLRRLGVSSSGDIIDTLNYTYNIRGWLQGINKSYVNNDASTSNWFGQELSYDYGFTIKQYSGNTTGVTWKTRSNSPSAYGFNFDKANRLTGAYFSQKASGSWLQGDKNFSVGNLTYDANGNIRTMLQKGMVGTVSKTIDSLTYTYPSNSNRLLAVKDIDSSVTKSARIEDFIDGNTTTKDYSYDANGNMIADLNKGVTSITYNHMNLPSLITMGSKGTITYQYDAAGNKLSKVVVDNTSGSPKTTRTDYAGAFVYRQDSIELISHEEGRIRPLYVTGQPIAYVYDYFEKDYLGNVRTILTEQTDFSMYAATMEIDAAAKETALFSNVEETRAEKPVGYPQDNKSSQNKFVAKLSARTGGKKIGPSLVLRVTAGDTVQINAQAFYKSQGPKDNGQTPPVEDMLIGLVEAFGGNMKTEGVHAAGTANALPFNADFYNNEYQRLKNRNAESPNSDRPKAYLNFVLFDDDFKLIEDNSGARQVKATPDELQELAVPQMAIPKSGFLYIYTSNESQQDVYFDNIIAGLNSGPFLEETHYYPYGMKMAGISSIALKDAKYPENRYKYNFAEFNKDLDVNLYEFRNRMYDPAIGRWHGIDNRPNVDYSLYTPMANNPINHTDILGDTTYRFNSSGEYIGMFDTDQQGILGQIGDYQTTINTKGKKQQVFMPTSTFHFNDEQIDREQLNALQKGSSEILVITDENINYIMKKSWIHWKPLEVRWAFAFAESRGRMDFNGSYLLQLKEIFLTGSSQSAAAADGLGGFVIFAGRPYVAYNLNDGGQFLWGHAMRRLGFSYSSAKFGSQANELFRDTKADQTAISTGFHYHVKTDKREAGVFETVPRSGF